MMDAVLIPVFVQGVDFLHEKGALVHLRLIGRESVSMVAVLDHGLIV